METLSSSQIEALGGCGEHRWLNLGTNEISCPHCKEEEEGQDRISRELFDQTLKVCRELVYQVRIGNFRSIDYLCEETYKLEKLFDKENKDWRMNKED